MYISGGSNTPPRSVYPLPRLRILHSCRVLAARIPRVTRLTLLAMSFLNRSKKKEAKEVPQWKLDMLRAESESLARSSDRGSSSSNATLGKRARDADAQELRGEDSLACARPSTSSAPEPPPPPKAAEDDDDDDDDNFDPSNYTLGDDDEEDANETMPMPPFAPVHELTVEQQLLMREAKYGARKSKTYYVEDQQASLVDTPGRERADLAKHLKKYAGGAAVPPRG